MKFPKPARKQDRSVIDQVKESPCCACGAQNVDAHHIKSVGSGGGDEFNNLLPLCRQHHTEVHALGLLQMCNKYPRILAYIREFK